MFGPDSANYLVVIALNPLRRQQIAAPDEQFIDGVTHVGQGLGGELTELSRGQLKPITAAILPDVGA
jgi:hypothetical protein